EPSSAQTFDLAPRMRYLREMRHARRRLRLYGSMAENGTHPRLHETVDRCVRMFRCAIVVAPVEHCRGSGVYLGDSSRQLGYVGIIGGVARCGAGVHVVVIVGSAEIASDAPDDRLPEMVVRID